MTLPLMMFAAGMGTRMGDLTRNQPKPMVTVAGKPLIDHALTYALPDLVAPIVVNLHYKADMLKQHLTGQDIIFSDETDKLLETGGGLKHALPLLGQGPVVTMNSDAIWQGPNPIKQVMAGWRNDMEALLLMLPKTSVKGHAGKGDFHRDEDGRLSRGPAEIYSGVQIIRTDRLDEIKEDVFSLNNLWDQMAERGGLYGISYPGNWCDVGQPSSIPLAEAMLDV